MYICVYEKNGGEGGEKEGGRETETHRETQRESVYHINIWNNFPHHLLRTNSLTISDILRPRPLSNLFSFFKQ